VDEACDCSTFSKNQKEQCLNYKNWEASLDTLRQRVIALPLKIC
jgi:hypothetical protein